MSKTSLFAFVSLTSQLRNDVEKFHGFFFRLSVGERMTMIGHDRAGKREKMFRNGPSNGRASVLSSRASSSGNRRSGSSLKSSTAAVPRSKTAPPRVRVMKRQSSKNKWFVPWGSSVLCFNWCILSSATLMKVAYTADWIDPVTVFLQHPPSLCFVKA